MGEDRRKKLSFRHMLAGDEPARILILVLLRSCFWLRRGYARAAVGCAAWLAVLIVFGFRTTTNLLHLKPIGGKVSRVHGTPFLDPLDSLRCVPGSAKRRAISFVFDLAIDFDYKHYRNHELFLKAAEVDADLVLILPQRGAVVVGDYERIGLSAEKRWELEQYYKIVEVDWITPPGLNKHIPLIGGCCGPREFMKLHALTLYEYDAVINLDNDVTIGDRPEDLKRLFDCAASGQFLVSRGSYSEINAGFFAARPQRQLFFDMVAELQVVSADKHRGWNDLGWGPLHKANDYRMQGFLYYYFYQRGSPWVEIAFLHPCTWTGPKFCNCYETALQHKNRKTLSRCTERKVIPLL